jgi:preprotein translocase subunit SecG
MSSPAGWYPQPDGQQRYWDGEQWTEDFEAGAGTPVTTPSTGGPARPQYENMPAVPMSDQRMPAPQIAPVPIEIKGSNGLAVAGFVLALLGALTSFIPIVNIGGDLLAFLGLIFGIIGLVQSGKKGAGKGLSIAAIILAIAAFVISIVVSNVAFSTVNDAVKTFPSAAATAEPTAEPTPEPTKAKVGSAIILKGNGSEGSQVTVTVVKIVDPTKSSNEFSTPTPGSRYVAVQFLITNTGTVPYSDSPSNGAKLADVQGQQFTSTYTAGITAGVEMPASVKLTPGGKALGYITFEVPKASKVATVQFGMDSGFADTGEWSVN